MRFLPIFAKFRMRIKPNAKWIKMLVREY